MAKKLDLPYQLQFVRDHGWFDDFYFYTTGQHGWSSSLTGSGTATVSSTLAGGVLNIAAVDSTANQANYVASTNPIYTFANDKPLIGECFVNFTEASTNQNNTVFGFSSVVSTLIASGSTGLVTNFWGACIYKQAGSTTNWKCCTSFGTTQTIDTTTINAQTANFTRLRIEVYPVSSTVLEVTYWIDVGKGLQQAKSNSVVVGFNNPIKHSGIYTTPTAMKLVGGMMNGTTAAETTAFDYMGGWQLRQTADSL